MAEKLTLESVDEDGALAEAMSRVSGSRGDFLRKAILGGSALLAVTAAPAAAAPSRRNDLAILNYALTLEYLQAVFYTEALDLGSLRGALEEQARIVGAHERGHVAALRKTLGREAIKRPRFNFRGSTESPEAFRKTAVAFEDLAVAAYKGQAPNIQSKAYLMAAISIHSVEARHAAWIRRLAGATPAAKPFDEPLSDTKVRQIVASTRFIVQTQKKTHRRMHPPFTG
jgi:Ferritin-like domain